MITSLLTTMSIFLKNTFRMHNQPQNSLEQYIKEFEKIKKITEKQWAKHEPDPSLIKYQFPKGTKWVGGISDEDIKKFEAELGFTFPDIYKAYLKVLNGVDKKAINTYGDPVKYPPSEAYVLYSYPRDINIFKGSIAEMYAAYEVTEKFIQENNIPHIIPIYLHRYLIADKSPSNLILSMWGTDTIFYCSDLISLMYTDIIDISLKVPIFVNDTEDFDYDNFFWVK